MLRGTIHQSRRKEIYVVVQKFSQSIEQQLVDVVLARHINQRSRDPREHREQGADDFVGQFMDRHVPVHRLAPRCLSSL